MSQMTASRSFGESSCIKDCSLAIRFCLSFCSTFSPPFHSRGILPDKLAYSIISRRRNAECIHSIAKFICEWTLFGCRFGFRAGGPEKIASLFFLAFLWLRTYYMGLCPMPRKPFEKGLSENFQFCSFSANSFQYQYAPPFHPDSRPAAASQSPQTPPCGR